MYLYICLWHSFLAIDVVHAHYFYCLNFNLKALCQLQLCIFATKHILKVRATYFQKVFSSTARAKLSTHLQILSISIEINETQLEVRMLALEDEAIALQLATS